MLKRHRALLSVLHVDFLLFDAADPLGELQVVGHRSGEHHDGDSIRELDDDLFPHRSTLLIIDVVNFVENDPLDVSNTRRIIVKHLLQDFSCHNQARCILVELDITSKHAHIAKL